MGSDGAYCESAGVCICLLALFFLMHLRQLCDYIATHYKVLLLVLAHTVIVNVC